MPSKPSEVPLAFEFECSLPPQMYLQTFGLAGSLKDQKLPSQYEPPCQQKDFRSPPRLADVVHLGMLLMKCFEHSPSLQVKLQTAKTTLPPRV